MRPFTSLTTLLIATLAFATAGCETTDRILTTAGQVAKGRTGQTIIDLAEGKDPAQIARHRVSTNTRAILKRYRGICAPHRKTLRPFSLPSG